MRYVICEWLGTKHPHIVSGGEVYNCPYKEFGECPDVPFGDCQNCSHFKQEIYDPEDKLTVEI